MIWTTWSFSVWFGIAVVAIITFCPGDIQVKAAGNELARHGVLMLASNSSWSAPNAGGGGPKIFIHNVGEEMVYETFQEKVEKFGEVTDFFNPGRGFAFITFSTNEEAQACIKGMDNTEVRSTLVKFEISRQ